MAIAHSRNARGQRHDLVDHLSGTAALAGQFAAKLDAASLGWRAGLWHDVGKFHPDFQEYLRRSEADAERAGHGPPHKWAGAVFARGRLDLLALPIAGHHGGLHGQADLKTRLKEYGAESWISEALALARAALPDLELAGPVPLPAFLAGGSKVDAARRGELFLRLLFSALCDADFLDTERHFEPERDDLRGGMLPLAELWARFEANQQRLSGEGGGEVNAVRHLVYRAAVRAAEQPAGFFRLTVPTGGGKTRSSMAFALRHALVHGQDRVIVALPYTSITDQTAQTYRSIFGGQRVVLEHHSALAEREDEEGRADPGWTRLAAENWDAPIVVTTTVQLFESLLARKPSRCRKLHNVARSVVILDEAQALPTNLLLPILDVLRGLVANYGTTVVLCTATQPAFEAIPAFADLAAAREIAPDPPALFARLKRVEYEWDAAAAPWNWERAADELRSAGQALAIVNTKADALALLDALDDPEALHLSTLLCGAHRRDVLDEVRARLHEGRPCRVVSTQVVEAGVDLDFPLVVRALGPLDRIVQAAGRCNREGRMTSGRVVVFRPAEGGLPPGSYRVGAQVTEALLATGADFHDPALYRRYFQQLLGVVPLDEPDVQQYRAMLDYPEVAARFRMIEDDSAPVVVPYARQPGDRQEVERLMEYVRRSPGRARETLRRLQPYLVNVRTRLVAGYQRQGLVEEIRPGLYRWHGGYDKVRGIVAAGRNPEDLVI